MTDPRPLPDPLDPRPGGEVPAEAVRAREVDGDAGDEAPVVRRVTEVDE